MGERHGSKAKPISCLNRAWISADRSPLSSFCKVLFHASCCKDMGLPVFLKRRDGVLVATKKPPFHGTVKAIFLI